MLACVQEIYADQAWTAVVLAAAVMAEHHLNHGTDPARVRQILADSLSRRNLPKGV